MATTTERDLAAEVTEAREALGYCKAQVRACRRGDARRAGLEQAERYAARWARDAERRLTLAA